VSLEERGGDVTEVAVSGLRYMGAAACFIDALLGNSPSCKPAAAGMVVQTGLGPQPAASPDLPQDGYSGGIPMSHRAMDQCWCRQVAWSCRRAGGLGSRWHHELDPAVGVAHEAHAAYVA